MDPVTGLGLAFAVPGVLDVLIRTCLEGYRFISTARSADETFEDHRYQFTIERQRLTDLTANVARVIHESSLRTDDMRFRLISSTLIRIAQQFSDFRQLELVYGVTVLSDDNSAEKPSKRSSIRKVFSMGKSQKDTKHETDAFEAVLNLDDLHLDKNLEIATLKTLEAPLKSVIDIYPRLRWACLDFEKTKTLIAKLEKYNDNIEHLVNGLNNEHGRGIITVVATTTKHKTHFMVPFPRNYNFIGVSHIEMWLADYHQKRIVSGQCAHTCHLRLALCGLGGIGKTQDVLSFIYGYENKRPVFWVHAGSIAQFEADCQKLASVAKIPGHENTEQHSGSIVKQWLESPESGEWILVLDNADNILDFYPKTAESTSSEQSNTIAISQAGIAKFIPRGSKGTIIVTTRDREVARSIAGPNVITKSKLHPEQALELFYHHCPNTEDTADDTSSTLQRLLEVLQYLPLAIVQAAAYLDLNRSVSIAKYIKIFESKKASPELKRLLSKSHNNIWRGNKGNSDTILTTYSISFRQIQQQSKLADSFLRFMACIDRKAIPRDLLTEIHLDGVEDGLLISEALDKLVNFSILQRAKVDFRSGEGYEIHSLVHLAMRTYLASGEMDTALNEASTVLVNTLPDSEYKNWAAWRVYLPHVMTLLKNLKQDSKASANLCMKAGRYLGQALGKYAEALKLYERARQLYTILSGEESAQTLWAIHCEGVLGVRRRTLGEEHPDTLDAMYHLASTYKALGGMLKEVQELEEKVLEVTRRTLGEEHPDTLKTMHNLALTYKRLGGRLKEVQELQEKVLEIQRRTLGEEHPDTSKAMENLAGTYKALGGRLKEVQELKENVLEVRRRTLGEEHPDTLKAKKNFASTYKALRRSQKEGQVMKRNNRPAR
ncbi:hypothetical protein BZA77DRAFT_384421 [Pyronema omphalodes]|nr:hypothetical protein BZA77DRAFT_384421 [Pyronema omphalodes]